MVLSQASLCSPRLPPWPRLLAGGRWLLGRAAASLASFPDARHGMQKRDRASPTSLRHQLARLPCLATYPLAGLSVARIPSPSLALDLPGASPPASPRPQRLPLPSLSLIGGGAGLVLPFITPLGPPTRSKNSRVSLASNCLGAHLLLRLRTLLIGWDTRPPCRRGAALAPVLLPARLAHSVAAALIGVRLVRCWFPSPARLGSLLRSHLVPAALANRLLFACWRGQCASAQRRLVALGPAPGPGSPGPPLRTNARWAGAPRLLGRC